MYANDSLAGARSPYEIAVKARKHPKEAALLFEQGAVKTWYASNGWTFPIEGSAGSGIGAVQQFFEALGLTKPPRLKIDSDTLVLAGKIGERLSAHLTVSTEERKPVYAQAWCNQQWVKFGPIKYLGKMVKLPVEITVPPYPGENLLAQVTVQGNGKQRFVVPVSLTVEQGNTPIAQESAPLLRSQTCPVAAAAKSGLNQDGSSARWWYQ